MIAGCRWDTVYPENLSWDAPMQLTRMLTYRCPINAAPLFHAAAAVQMTALKAVPLKAPGQRLGQSAQHTAWRMCQHLHNQKVPRN
jgi:hypothetical protein